jgi:DNA repair protein RecN (Recombination protein N)
MGQLGLELSELRTKAAEALIAQVGKELNDLNMPQVRFDVSITRKPAGDNGIPSPDGSNYEFTKKGIDTVEFMVSTNPGEPFKPLAKIASTGEVSRFMLALKSTFSKTDNIPILVFDEIDIGVGGRCGEVIGEKLWSLSKNRQVICITHLPQIAVFADAHFNIRKNISGSRTTTNLESLQGEALIQELAVMLVGSHYTEASIKSVRELMQKAKAWKKVCG